MSEILDTLRQAVAAWYKITGCPTDRYGSRTLGDFHTMQEAEQVAELLALDPTGLSSFILLRAYYEERLKGTSFNAYDLILRRGEVEAKLRELESLRDLLQTPEILEYINESFDKLRQAVIHYGATPDDSLFKSDVFLAILLRDAVLGIHKLRVHQFVQGEPSKVPLGLNPHVYEFWNIPSLIRAMQTQGYPGVTLCLIRDPDVFQSFFVFAISNGENLTVLTDKQRATHPGQRDMKRRADRELLRRASQYHFPYELLDLKGDEEQERLYKVARQGLVPYQTKAVKLADIKDLYPDTVLWLAMMFDLINDKFGKQCYKAPELTYTTHMIREPEAAVSAGTALVMSGQYKPLAIQDITKADLTDGKLTDQWERSPTGHNDWMVERYGPQVPDEVLNLVGEHDKAKVLTFEAEGALLAPKKDSWGKIATYDGKMYSRQFKAMDPLDFGTEAEIRRDYVWTARHNQMAAIQRLADAEFNATKDQILGHKHDRLGRSLPVQGWFVDAVQRNRKAIIEAVARGEMLSSAHAPGHYYNDTTKDEPRNLITFGGDWGFEVVLIGDFRHCCIKDIKTRMYAVVRPRVSDDLAILLGMKKEDLPWQLQHWSTDSPYHGNAILDRLDPKDWVLKNPWQQLKFTVLVHLSQSGYNEIRKSLGLPRQPVPGKWKSEDED